MEKPQYIAQFKTVDQLSPDPYHWVPVTPSLKITDGTTIGQIRQWMNEKHAETVKEFKIIKIDTL